MNRGKSSAITNKLPIRMKQLAGETGDIDEVQSEKEDENELVYDNGKAIRLEDVDLDMPALHLASQ